MQIAGVGIDVETIAATDLSITRYGSSWLKRQFTNFEIDRAPKEKGSAAYFTTLFAAKEAVSKALENGINDELPLLSIQVDMRGLQINSINFLPPAIALISKLEIKQVKVGVAHFGDHIIATAVAEK
jgi:phosphopantetheine--protein transferase-like protein